MAPYALGMPADLLKLSLLYIKGREAHSRKWFCVWRGSMRED